MDFDHAGGPVDGSDDPVAVLAPARLCAPRLSDALENTPSQGLM